MPKILDAVTEKDAQGQGVLSFSRALPFFFAGIITAAWLGVGAWIVWASLQDSAAEVWPRVSGWLNWGRDLFFVTVIPYAGKSLGKIGQKSG